MRQQHRWALNDIRYIQMLFFSEIVYSGPCFVSALWLTFCVNSWRECCIGDWTDVVFFRFLGGNGKMHLEKYLVAAHADKQEPEGVSITTQQGTGSHRHVQADQPQNAEAASKGQPPRPCQHLNLLPLPPGPQSANWGNFYGSTPVRWASKTPPL